MTGTNEHADMKIRLERMERLVSEQALKISELQSVLTQHNAKLELLKDALLNQVATISSDLETVSEAVVVLLLKDKLRSSSFANGSDSSQERIPAYIRISHDS